MKRILPILLGLSLMSACRWTATTNDDIGGDATADNTLAFQHGRDTSLLFFSRDTGLYINKEYIVTISDVEKAALAYVATFIGCDCWWADDHMDADRGNLDCKIISALGLGFQCSETHLGFLRSHFAKDSTVLSELEDAKCPTTPYTATVQNTFDDIQLTLQGDSIIIYYAANGINVRAEMTWHWTETMLFIVSKDQLYLVDKQRSEVVRKSFGD